MTGSLIWRMYMPARRFKYLLFIAAGFFYLSARSQQFGGNPPSTRWKQLSTDSLRIIFPETWNGDVHRLAALASPLYSNSHSLGNRFRKFDIVIQNQTTVSNAYVGIGPSRSEFYTTPLQNSFVLGSLPWAEQLMLHEYRHIHQFSNFNKGISRLFYFLSGELGLSLINNTAVPNWFWEGDAVYQETKESGQGRGRLPYFFNGYRSLWLEGRTYSWLKLRNGSLRDYVPDHYQLGYLLTAYGTEKWGEHFWGKVTDDAVRFKGLFYPFQKAVTRATGMRYPAFIREAFAHADSAMDTTGNQYAKNVFTSRHFAGDQEFPHFVDTGRILYLSGSYRNIPAFVVKEMRTGKEHKVRVRDISLDNHFSYRNGMVVYAALAFDPRWAWRNYSDIRLLDIHNGRQHRVTRHGRFFSPDISSDGTEIVAVEMPASGESRLRILSASDGTLMDSFPAVDKWVYTYPKFMGKHHIVAAVRNGNGEMALLRLQRGTGAADTLIPFSMHVIGFPAVSGDTVCVTVSMGSSDRLMMVLSSGIFEVLPAALRRLNGRYQLQWMGERMAWVEFTSSGHRMQTGAWPETQLIRLEKQDFSSPLPDFGYRKVNRPYPLLSAIPSTEYPIGKYPKATRLLNIHSWLPLWSDPEYSLTFLSENVLNTLQGEAAFTFNRNEQSKRWSASGTYGGLFPWLRAGVSYTADRSFRRFGQLVRWNEWELRGGFSVPLNFSGGRSYADLRISTDYAYAKPSYQGIFKDTFSGKGYGYLDHQLVFSHQIQQARQHIFPRLAQTLRLGYVHTVSGRDARQFLASGNLYFPGVHVNHHFVVQASWQQRDTLRRLFFSNNFPFSRGYDRLNFHQMFRWALNYHFPVAYPDWGMANIVYFLRLRANLFYDHTRVWDYARNGQAISGNFRSLGIEFYFDTKWWNQQPVSFGMRYSRLLDPKNAGQRADQWEFVLPVNLISR